MVLLRQSGPYIFSAIAGLATGAGLYVLYFRLSQELAQIRALLEELKQEIKKANNNAPNRKRRNRTSGYYSAVTDSGDEDEDFEDALAGFSDAEELFGKPSGSSERNVQFATPLSTEITTEGSDEQFFAQIDAYIASGSKADYENAYVLLQERKLKMSLKVEFQWRLAKVAYFIANAAGERGEKERKKELMYQAKDAAQAAINLDENCAHGHKWYAITLGCVGDYEPTSEKIKNAVVIKEHIQQAIDLNPSDPTPHHMLGRWCYSVYMLSWLERKAAAAFFGSPPTATVEEALEHFEEAERLNPGKWKENSLYLGKCLLEKRQYDESVKWFRLAKAGPDDVEVDEEVQKEVRNLLSKYDH